MGRKMSTMACYDIFDGNNAPTSVTALLTEATKACQNREQFFVDLFRFMDNYDEDVEYNEEDFAENMSLSRECSLML